MSKKKKILMIILAVLIVIAVAVLVAGKIAVDYVFDKAYNEIVNGNIQAEITEPETEEDTVIGEDGEIYELAGEEDAETQEIVGNDGQTYTVKKPAAKKEEKPVPRIKNVNELSQQEIADIQAMVSTADKVAVFNICKSAATSEDRKEVKEMMENGNMNYGRVREILSQRLTAEQKAQIYAYYEKYAAKYFGVE